MPAALVYSPQHQSRPCTSRACSLTHLDSPIASLTSTQWGAVNYGKDSEALPEAQGVWKREEQFESWKWFGIFWKGCMFLLGGKSPPPIIPQVVILFQLHVSVTSYNNTRVWEAHQRHVCHAYSRATRVGWCWYCHASVSLNAQHTEYICSAPSKLAPPSNKHKT